MNFIKLFLIAILTIISQQTSCMLFPASTWQSSRTPTITGNAATDPICNHKTIKDYEQSYGAQELFNDYFARQAKEEQKRKEQQQEEEIMRSDTANTSPGAEKIDRARARQQHLIKKETRRAQLEQKKSNTQKKRAFLEK